MIVPTATIWTFMALFFTVATFIPICILFFSIFLLCFCGIFTITDSIFNFLNNDLN